MPVLIMLISSRPEHATLQTWSSSGRDSEIRKLVPLVIRTLREIGLLKQVSPVHLHTAHIEKRNVLVCAGQEFVSQYDDWDLVVLSIVEGVESVVEALRYISRGNDDPGKFSVSRVKCKSQIGLFGPSWQSCCRSSSLP